MDSPLDPTIFGTMDGFPEGFPFPIPPSTGPTIPIWPDDTTTRDAAISLGQRHNEAMAALTNLAGKHGGGLTGAAKGLLEEYERRGIITYQDKTRLVALLNVFKEMGPEQGTRRIQELHDEAVSDPSSKPAALAALSVALSSVTSTTNTPHEADVYAAGYADAVGVMFGMGGGVFGAVLGGVIASEVAYHTHINVSWT